MRGWALAGPRGPRGGAEPGSAWACTALEDCVACAAPAGSVALTATPSPASAFAGRLDSPVAGPEALRELGAAGLEERIDPGDADEAAASAWTAASRWSTRGDGPDGVCVAYAAKSRMAAFLAGGLGKGMV